MPGKLRIVFMGTPEFAVATLDALVRAGHEIAAVITVPDKPAGRGMKLQESAVKKYAMEHGLRVLQPEKLKDPAFLDAYTSLEHDLNIVVAFRMLPEVVWNHPRLGTFNLHASLLPQYRGAAPINWAVINGEKETGVTTFFINHEIDTGQIISQQKVTIRDDETAGELHDELMVTGAKLVLKTVESLEKGAVNLTDQSQIIQNQSLILKPAPKLFKEDARIDFTAPLASIYNLIRGLSPYPAAFIGITDRSGQELPVKVYRSRADHFTNTETAGDVETDGKTFIRINHPEGALYLEELQAPGRKRLKVDEFLRGFPLSTGDWKVKHQER
jgi:methionyl-tRNA formyltransferase